MFKAHHLIGAGIAAIALTAATPVFAQEAEAAAAANPAFIFNTLLFLLGGILVVWMAAGFAMLEAGMVQAKNVSMQCTKNIALYSIAGLMFWLIGYNVMYEGVDGGYIGTFLPKAMPAAAGDTGDYSAASDWFFQMAFCATAASIVSGTLAERIKLWPFLIFVALLTGILYPIIGAWTWGGGFLNKMGFLDFAGSSIVHSTGGWAALAGAILLGARTAKYADGKLTPLPGSNMPLATLGTFILWLGWFGFNGASQLAFATNADATAVSTIFVNTNLAAAAGVVVAILLSEILYKKVDLTFALNGALAGLVAITAEPLTPSPVWAIIIGAIGGVIVIFTVPLLDRLKIDDVVGAIPVHLFAGIWGTMAVPLTNSDATFVTQAIGVGAIGGFVFIVSFVFWALMKFTVGIRCTPEQELKGLDVTEIGLEAYPEFKKGY
ncbi:MAG: ammonium transporter [Rhodomicrobium sp.]|nr:MAG: ammonium transporter [Rhodomicrobium sp.]